MTPTPNQDDEPVTPETDHEDGTDSAGGVSFREEARMLPMFTRLKYGALLAFVAMFVGMIGYAMLTSSRDGVQGGSIRTALYFASGTDVDGSVADVGVADAIRDGLRKAFREQHFQLLGEHTHSLAGGDDSWEVPAQEFVLKIDSRGAAENSQGINVHLQLWQEKNALWDADVVLSDRPTFLRGPDWAGGFLVLVMALEGR